MKIVHQGASLNQASKALILLHGRGGNAEEMLSLAAHFTITDCYIASLQAPHHTWYPFSFMAEDTLNEPNLFLAVSSIKSVIDDIATHIPTSLIFIMGFSQGACLALETGARFATRYGGIIAFTGGLIGHQIDETRYKGDFKGTPIFMSNGDHDPHIPLERSQQSQQFLEKMGAKVTLKVYKDRPHMISDDEISFVKDKLLS